MSIKPKVLYNILKKNGVEFYTGVPDSTIKDFCFYLEEVVPSNNHIIAANEGNSIGIATGYHLSSGKIPFVYMQNSGLGNAINPLTSLADETVFSIPMIIMIGWRGEPGTKDAVQHQKDGEIQEQLLKALKIPYQILSLDNDKLESQITLSIETSRTNSSPFVILVRRNSFDKFIHDEKQNQVLFSDMSREYALSNIYDKIEKNAIIVSTTGKISRELNEIKTKSSSKLERELMVVGSMGHASSIALGVSINSPEHQLYCIDGDGSIIMHMGIMATVGKYSTSNFKHILINNFSHDSVGGQSSNSEVVNFSYLSKSFSYKNFFQISKKSDFNSVFDDFLNSPAPSLLEIIVNKGARSDLPRPNRTPLENKKDFMNFLGI
tara:strand:- start:1204 stop:2340 length:1137 start_codon:yes stop_codon:yes gene_type:complete